jgi:GTP cyclohydrolase II
MARGPELRAFAREHDLQLISIADLVAYRLQVERIVERAAEARLPLASGRFTAVAYRSRLDGREHVAFVRGDVADDPNVSVHVHRECLLGDVFGSTRCGCGEALRASLVSVGREGRGVVLYLRHDPRRPLLAHVTGFRWRDPAWGGTGASGAADDDPALDEITVHDGAVARQILDDLGVDVTPMVPPGLCCVVREPGALRRHRSAGRERGLPGRGAVEEPAAQQRAREQLVDDHETGSHEPGAVPELGARDPQVAGGERQ